MSDIIFYGKPGCINNRKQLRLLEDAGINVTSVDILKEPWTYQRLADYFVGLTKHKWVNTTAPAIKKNEIVLESIPDDKLIEAMCQDPILIRRPLLDYQGKKRVGFDWQKLCTDFGLEQQELVDDIEHCVRERK